MTAIPEEQMGRFRCPVCPRGFFTLRAKRIHIKTKHPRPKKRR